MKRKKGVALDTPPANYYMFLYQIQLYFSSKLRRIFLPRRFKKIVA